MNSPFSTCEGDGAVWVRQRLNDGFSSLIFTGPLLILKILVAIAWSGPVLLYYVNDAADVTLLSSLV